MVSESTTSVHNTSIFGHAIEDGLPENKKTQYFGEQQFQLVVKDVQITWNKYKNKKANGIFC